MNECIADVGGQGGAKARERGGGAETICLWKKNDKINTQCLQSSVEPPGRGHTANVVVCTANQRMYLLERTGRLSKAWGIQT